MTNKYLGTLFLRFQEKGMNQEGTQHEKAENIPGNGSMNFRGSELIPAEQKYSADKTESEVFRKKNAHDALYRREGKGLNGKTSCMEKPAFQSTSSSKNHG